MPQLGGGCVLGRWGMSLKDMPCAKLAEIALRSPELCAASVAKDNGRQTFCFAERSATSDLGAGAAMVHFLARCDRYAAANGFRAI